MPAPSQDPQLRSWVESANEPGCDFPIQNLPYCVFAPAGQDDWRIGVGIGTSVLDLREAVRRTVFGGPAWQPLCADALNEHMAQGPQAWSRVRADVARALSAGSEHQQALRPCLRERSQLRLRVPARIGDYTDFYSSIHHATRVGQLLRPDAPLLPNYRWMPIAYHGRSSSIVVSGTAVIRPCGQVLVRGAAEPVLMASRRLDYELELAAYVGAGNAAGLPIPVESAEEQVFGMCLLNDWSARDLQGWEYQPLGPFLAKNFATSVSPWIVSMEALAPFRAPWSRPAADPQALPYLEAPRLRESGALDIHLSVHLRTARMASAGEPAVCLAQTNYSEAYWCLAQLLAHHSVNGCNLRPGDLIASGTQSGAHRDQSGSLLERTQGGKCAIALPNGQERRFLEDGDEVTLRAWCERPGAVRIGFGECVGVIAPARAI